MKVVHGLTSEWITLRKKRKSKQCPWDRFGKLCHFLVNKAPKKVLLWQREHPLPKGHPLFLFDTSYKVHKGLTKCWSSKVQLVVSSEFFESVRYTLGDEKATFWYVHTSGQLYTTHSYLFYMSYWVDWLEYKLIYHGFGPQHLNVKEKPLDTHKIS